VNNEFKRCGGKGSFLKNHYTVPVCASGDENPHEKLNVNNQCSDRVLGRRTTVRRSTPSRNMFGIIKKAAPGSYFVQTNLVTERRGLPIMIADNKNSTDTIGIRNFATLAMS
jgi:hypothetical protein